MDAPTAPPDPTQAQAQAPSAINAEVQRLLDASKAKQAVELAKDLHKKRKNPQTEHQLVVAYLARIEQFQNKGMAQEAQTLITLVTERFPAQKHLLGRLSLRAAMEAGRYDQVLGPLTSDTTPAADKQFIESLIRQRLSDLPALAVSTALPEDHPLRRSAAAVWGAFGAVTSGAVTDETIALPTVSHRSPLAGWKLLIRAIAAFYRNEDEAARRALDAIPADALVQRLGATLRSLIDRNPPTAGLAGALCARIVPDEKKLEAALQRVDSWLNSEYQDGLNSAIHQALQVCAAQRPELLETLRRRIITACIAIDAIDEDMVAVVGKTNIDAAYWRILGRASTGRAFPWVTAAYWERFYVHGVHEGLFQAEGLEAAAIWLRIAELTSSAKINIAKQRHLGYPALMGPYEEGNRPEIRALRPPPLIEYVDNVLDPMKAFERAARLHPSLEVFTKWWAWAQRAELKTKEKERVLTHWTEKRPTDSQPLVTLALIAEQRDSLSLALKRIAAAEQVDPLNPQVRQARIRLMLAVTWRHFRSTKSGAVEQDLAQLAALPAMREGDRSAVVACMFSVWHEMSGRAAESQERQQAAIAQLEQVCQQLVMSAVQTAGDPDNRRTPAPPEPKPTSLEIARAVARFIGIARDLNLPTQWPAKWKKQLEEALKHRPCPLSAVECLLIGDGAVENGNSELAYAASAAALSRADTPAATARALLLRGRALGKARFEDRCMQCLQAALELARTAHDEPLINSIMSEMDNALNKFVGNIFGPPTRRPPLSRELIDEVLSNEREAVSFPTSQLDRRYVVQELLQPLYDNPFDNFFGPEDDDDDDDDDDDSFDFSGSIGPDSLDWDDVMPANIPLPPGGREQVIARMKQRGLTPSTVAEDPEILLDVVAQWLMESIQNGSIDPVELGPDFPTSGMGSALPSPGKPPKKKRR